MPVELKQIQDTGAKADPVGHLGLISQPNCEVCPLRGCRIVPPNGNPRARIAIVGEGPGYNEDLEGRGFVGKAGKLLNILLERVGIVRSECWISNAALCPPRPVTLRVDIGTPQDRYISLDVDKVKDLSVRACRPRLLQELLLIRPSMIIPAGGLALWSLSGRMEGITARRGAIHELPLEQLLQTALEDLPRVARLEPFPGSGRKRKETGKKRKHAKTAEETSGIEELPF